MKFLLKPISPEKIETDLMVIFCSEEKLDEVQVDPIIKQQIKISAQREEFFGKDKQLLIISPQTKFTAYKLMLVGLGKTGEFDLPRLKTVVGKIIKTAKEMKIKSIAFSFAGGWHSKYSIKEVIKSLTQAVILSSYQFFKYKSEEQKKHENMMDEIVLAVNAGVISAADEAKEEGQLTGEAVCYCRDLINEPAAVTTPSYLAQEASKIAKESKERIKVKILEKDEIEKLGMRAYLGVAKGSDEPPKFIRLSYKPSKSSKKVVIVGKGITFDTGGLSLKSQEQMETMKQDMAGAAIVLGLFKVLPHVNLSCEVIGLIPACENMPSGKALRPGDILTALNGKTIEVLNTDAEGRLTLADAFSYCLKYEKADYLIDLATLTGACRMALGEDIAGLWSNDKELAEKLLKASEISGEQIWQMPLYQDYKDLLKSHVADIRNVQTGRVGGAITAALFLEEFVGTVPWAHLDIAGPAFVEKASPLVPVGGSGFGVQILLEFLKSI